MRIKVIHETSKCSEVAKNFILINVDIITRLHYKPEHTEWQKGFIYKQKTYVRETLRHIRVSWVADATNIIIFPKFVGLPLSLQFDLKTKMFIFSISISFS